ncbi:hypothetical protein [Sphingobacterium paucimobilis]|uniref:Uncharacterized protein n=1 Tax=Sphingobacterium paucimobilis HER1398 TaxID=1346330 RepID=U2HX72_9SPHI|nr:hypothetical protein [Sphingobacterium paucimobilis]ERJ59875.1 hypothetical protein M472_13975 [Sphingobacterium paucimobilis HER1398]
MIKLYGFYIKNKRFTIAALAAIYLVYQMGYAVGKSIYFLLN